MSVKAMTWVWEHSQAKGAARMVLLALADHAGADGGDAYPSVARLSERCHLSERAVQEAVKTLVMAGELEVEQNTGPRGTNRYRLTFTPAESAPPAPAEDSPPQNLHPAVCDAEGVQIAAERGADSAPEPRDNQLQEPSARSLAADLVAIRDRSPRALVDEPFERFCASFPRMRSKGTARKAWFKAIRKADPELLIAAAAAYRDDPLREDKFTKAPATWLDDECWLDDRSESRISSTGSTVARRLVERFGGMEAS